MFLKTLIVNTMQLLASSSHSFFCTSGDGKFLCPSRAWARKSGKSIQVHCKSIENHLSLRPPQTNFKTGPLAPPSPADKSLKGFQQSCTCQPHSFTQLHQSSRGMGHQLHLTQVGPGRTTCPPPSEVPTAPPCEESVESPPMTLFEQSFKAFALKAKSLSMKPQISEVMSTVERGSIDPRLNDGQCFGLEDWIEPGTIKCAQRLPIPGYQASIKCTQRLPIPGYQASLPIELG